MLSAFFGEFVPFFFLFGFHIWVFRGLFLFLDSFISAFFTAFNSYIFLHSANLLGLFPFSFFFRLFSFPDAFQTYQKQPFFYLPTTARRQNKQPQKSPFFIFFSSVGKMHDKKHWFCFFVFFCFFFSFFVFHKFFTICMVF